MFALFVLLLVSCKTDKKTETAKTDEIKVEESVNDDIKLEKRFRYHKNLHQY